jgi:D-mannonate dehydratase
VLNRVNLSVVDGAWQLHDFVKVRLTVESQGLKLSALENVSLTMMPDVFLGAPNRDQQTET